jgi:hypothetical protein
MKHFQTLRVKLGLFDEDENSTWTLRMLLVKKHCVNYTRNFSAQGLTTVNLNS